MNIGADRWKSMKIMNNWSMMKVDWWKSIDESRWLPEVLPADYWKPKLGRDYLSFCRAFIFSWAGTGWPGLGVLFFIFWVVWLPRLFFDFLCIFRQAFSFYIVFFFIFLWRRALGLPIVSVSYKIQILQKNELPKMRKEKNVCQK